MNWNKIEMSLEQIDNNIDIINSQIKRLNVEVEKELGYEIPEKLWDMFVVMFLKQQDKRDLLKLKTEKETIDIFTDIVRKYNLDMGLNEDDLKNQ